MTTQKQNHGQDQNRKTTKDGGNSMHQQDQASKARKTQANRPPQTGKQTGSGRNDGQGAGKR